MRPQLAEGLVGAYLKGKKLIEAEELEAGIDLWHQIAKVTEKQVGRSERCWLLLRIGDAWAQARRWKEAHGAYRSALEAAQAPLSMVTNWLSIGNTYKEADELENAREAYGSAQRLLERTWGEGLFLARVLRELGILDWRQGRLDSSQSYLQRALKIRQKLAPGSLDVASSLNNLGGLAWKLHDLDRATQYFESSLRLRQKLAPGSLDLAMSLNNLGVLASKRGNLDRAAEYYGRALKIQQSLAPGSLPIAGSLLNLGLLAYDRGDFDRAAEYYEKALAIQQRVAPGSFDVALSLTNLGALAYKRSDLNRAAQYHERSLEIEQKLAPGGLSVALSLYNLGLLAYDRGNSTRAIEYFERSLEIQQKLAPAGLDAAGSLNNLGLLAHDRGDLDQAAEYHKRCLEIVQKLTPAGLDMATSLHNLGLLKYDLWDPGKAAEYLERSLEIRQKLAPGSSIEAETLHALGSLRREEGLPRAAFALRLRALQALEKQITRLGGSRDIQAGFRADRAAYYHDTIGLSLELQQPLEAFHILERSRARSFLDQLAERDLIFSDIPEELDRYRRRIAVLYERSQQELAKLSLAKDKERIEALQGKLQSLQEERYDIEEKIRREYPDLAALQFPQPLDLQATRKILDPGTLMLSYSVGKESTDVFVVANMGKLDVHTVQISREHLQHEVDLLRKYLLRPHLEDRDLQSLLGVGQRLYTALIEVAVDRVEVSRRLLIVPDGPLHLLPFAALIRDENLPTTASRTDDRKDSDRDWHYLAEWKPIHSVLSATVYAELKKSRRPTEASGSEPAPIQLTAFGDPRYPRDRGNGRHGDLYVRAAAERGFEFQQLPYTRREIEGITERFPAGSYRAFLGEEATEERVKSIGRNTRILHIAAHGRVENGRPLDSFVALTIPPPGDDRENGLLQAWEIFESVRLDADLVVLSACETGVGKELGGDGLIGLTRAFQYAGARTVAATLWNVADQATAELMIRFYRHLQAGQPKDVALQLAQIELIRRPIQVQDENGKTVEIDASAPYYWAAFQLYGDWQ